jgi:hypothetical protein
MARRRPQLANVLIGANPNAQQREGWSNKTQRSYDVGPVERIEDDARYAITVNVDRVAAGTVGWVHRFNGSDGELAAVCVFTGPQKEKSEPKGVVAYAPGTLWVLPTSLRLMGTEIQAGGWSTSPPYGDLTNQRFANGVVVNDENLAALRRLLDPRVLAWVLGQVAARAG